MTSPVLISVDWGTTSLRCCLMAQDGSVLARRDDGPGILAVTDGGFAAALGGEIAAWLAELGRLPVMLSGMIGSRQGWVEVPYLPCPASGRDVAGALTLGPASPLGALYFVPGLQIEADGAAPDVMRGEETQVFGVMAGLGLESGLFVLPGTHSKWVSVAGGAITSFATYMTGEVFAALCHHTILGRLMPGESGAPDSLAFGNGVKAGAAEGPPGALLNRIFSTRTLGLFDKVPATGLESYLSGLLIGAEMATAVQLHGGHAAAGFTIIGNAALTARYEQAASILGLEARVAPADSAARGALSLAHAAGLLEGKDT